MPLTKILSITHGSTTLTVLLIAELANKLGYHPIHFGVLTVIVILIGAVTPPVGGMLFVSLGIAKILLKKPAWFYSHLLPY